MNDFSRHLEGLRQGVGAAHSAARAAAGAAQTAQGQSAQLQQEILRMRTDIANLSTALASVQATSSGGPGTESHIRYIEQIPGRRIPFDLLVQIPIGPNITAEQQAVTQISQDGPFVAVARYATFQSAYSFSRRDPETNAVMNFQGRSYGRYRPVSSVGDLLDGAKGYQPTVGSATPGSGQGIYAGVSNHSNFRSMEFDGIVQFLNQGSGWQRSNIPVPSSFYMQEINSPFLLGALDFFERGETLQWRVTPTHPNNPNFGNAFGFASGGAYPFDQSQYDVQEGILDPQVADLDTDPISRLPAGILTIGFHGYRIIQPPGPVSMT